MKFVLISLALVVAGFFPTGETRFASININMAMTVSDDSHKLSEDMVRICAQETDISMEELHKFRRNDFANPSESTQCFAHCVYEQMGLVRDGVFVERDALRTLADVTDPNYYYIAKECHGIKGSNKCETAFKIHQCHQQHRMNQLPKDVNMQASPMEPSTNNGDMMQ